MRTIDQYVWAIDRGTTGDKSTVCVMFCGVLFLVLFPGQTNSTASSTEQTNRAVPL